MLKLTQAEKFKKQLKHRLSKDNTYYDKYAYPRIGSLDEHTLYILYVGLVKCHKISKYAYFKYKSLLDDAVYKIRDIESNKIKKDELLMLKNRLDRLHIKLLKFLMPAFLYIINNNAEFHPYKDEMLSNFYMSFRNYFDIIKNKRGCILDNLLDRIHLRPETYKQSEDIYYKYLIDINNYYLRKEVKTIAELAKYEQLTTQGFDSFEDYINDQRLHIDAASNLRFVEELEFKRRVCSNLIPDLLTKPLRVNKEKYYIHLIVYLRVLVGLPTVYTNIYGKRCIDIDYKTITHEEKFLFDYANYTVKNYFLKNKITVDDLCEYETFPTFTELLTKEVAQWELQ